MRNLTVNIRGQNKKCNILEKNRIFIYLFIHKSYFSNLILLISN